MVNACVIGLGNRSRGLIDGVLTKMDNLRIVAVCDRYTDRVEDVLQKLGGAKGFTDYKEALAMPGIDACFVFTGWEMHTEVSVYAMEKGIAVACEVGSECSLENCFRLVRTQEQTGTPYMMVENCCWGKEELLATSMARKGVFGTVVHCSGAYAHDLRSEVSYGLTNRHYRFAHYLNRCYENYPTHELGPIAKLLDINRGNRILTVSSFASKAAGLEEYIQTRPDATDEMKSARFKQGDIVTTVLTCANGETIVLKLDTTLPRTYSREFTVRGTKGMYSQDFNSVFLDGDTEYWEMPEYLKNNLNNAVNYEEQYLPQIWKEVTAETLAAGHGGMDWFAYCAFVNALETGAPMPVDVYDSATWQAVSVLSEISIQLGGAPQAMPDFTNGKWFHRPRLDVCEL